MRPSRNLDRKRQFPLSTFFRLCLQPEKLREFTEFFAISRKIHGYLPDKDPPNRRHTHLVRDDFQRKIDLFPSFPRNFHKRRNIGSTLKLANRRIAKYLKLANQFRSGGPIQTLFKIKIRKKIVKSFHSEFQMIWVRFYVKWISLNLKFRGSETVEVSHFETPNLQKIDFT